MYFVFAADGLVKMGGECVSQCAAGYTLNEDRTECINCGGVCPVGKQNSEVSSGTLLVHTSSL